MDALASLAQGFEIALTPTNLLFVFIGVLIGQVIGALPGIGPAAGMALLLPVTFGMNPTTAIVMLTGIMYGGMYGGTLTSVLVNVPGEASSVMTAVDGHELAKRGRAGAALSIAAIGSFLAGVGAVSILVFATPVLATFGLRFSSPEFFLLALLGLTATASLRSGSMVKTLIVAAFGLMIAMIGTDPIAGTDRLTYGQLALIDGLDFLPIAIGIFGVAEVLVSLERLEDVKPIKMRLRDLMLTKAEWLLCRKSIARGGTVGFLVGVLPGAGPTIAAFIAYILERRFSPNPAQFGHGALDGVAASESANNAAAHAGLVPMLGLGIPAGAGSAVLMSALVLQGIRPGPMLMTEQPGLVWGLIASMFVGNVMLLALNLPLAPVFASLLRVPYAYLAPPILVFSLVGAYATTSSMFTVGVALLFGAIGYIMIKANLPRAPLVLALVLAPLLESSLRQSLTFSQGSPMIFVERPISAVLLVVVLLTILSPIFAAVRSHRRRRVTQIPAEPAEIAR